MSSSISYATTERSCDGFMCYSGLCLPGHLQNDGITDCPGLHLEDEVVDDSSK